VPLPTLSSEVVWFTPHPTSSRHTPSAPCHAVVGSRKPPVTLGGLRIIALCLGLTQEMRRGSDKCRGTALRMVSPHATEYKSTGTELLVVALCTIVAEPEKMPPQSDALSGASAMG
jgi:hypothetical protein